MRSLSVVLLAALGLPGVALAQAAQVSHVHAMQHVPPYVRAAVADPARGQDANNDARRKITDVMVFSEVKPGQKVLELIPGSGYFTRVFSAIVGTKGHVYALWPNEYAKEDADDVTGSDKLAADPHYANVSVLKQPAAQLSVPEPVDLVFTSQNYHDYPDAFMGKVDPVAFDKQVYAALKPGGLFVVIDHVAPAGSGMADTDTLHRIDPAIVKKQVESVGFVFAGESSVLHNPDDPHTNKVFDSSIRGHTDQFVYRFRKPN
ncbi:class I SAM-dependent methyltransferase [Dyella mobilis]|uniref:Class I SAM-dependent methyltransferase n=1 Tax=Dyella mobilis TaxID=1849582 RepID=A0ABS2KKV1_9GAMM|nr:class I SAM-dependent methyltransferase [Dyella mobilis]MBM7131776.1 class I SAM-dependent methyltransferase [Dyella mobilis]GLQ96245.1 methyltransferase [Dyella mobilis]